MPAKPVSKKGAALLAIAVVFTAYLATSPGLEPTGTTASQETAFPDNSRLAHPGAESATTSEQSAPDSPSPSPTPAPPRQILAEQGAKSHTSVQTDPSTEFNPHARVIVAPNAPGIGIVSVQPMDVTCFKNGEEKQVKLAETFSDVQTKRPYRCVISNGPQREHATILDLERLKTLDFDQCELTLQITTIDLEKNAAPTQTIERETIFDRDHYRTNTQRPTQLADALQTLNAMQTRPDVIVTYGKHEPAEPSARLFDAPAKKDSIAAHFGPNVLFIQIPESETPAGYYKSVMDEVELQYWNGSKKISDGLKAKLTPLMKTPPETIMEENQIPKLTSEEGLELYRLADKPLPMAEQEFATKALQSYAGCPAPIFVSIHHGSEQSKILAFQTLIDRRAGMFRAIRQRTGITAIQDTETRELADAIGKMETKTDLAQKLDAMMNVQPGQTLANPLLARQLYAEYVEQTGRFNDQNNENLPYFTVELGRPDTSTPIGGKVLRGFQLREMMFREYPTFDHTFAVGSHGYLSALDADVPALLAGQRPQVVDLLEETLKESKKS